MEMYFGEVSFGDGIFHDPVARFFPARVFFGIDNLNITDTQETIKASQKMDSSAKSSKLTVSTSKQILYCIAFACSLRVQ